MSVPSDLQYTPDRLFRMELAGPVELLEAAAYAALAESDPS